MSDEQTTKLSSTAIVDTLYDIALDPTSLDDFVETWTDAGLDSHQTREMLEGFGEFDDVYQAHISRAETFLRRGTDLESGPDFAKALAPFESLAAFIVDRALNVVAANDGAVHSFGVTAGAPLADVQFPAETVAPLTSALQKTLQSPKPTQHLLKLEAAENPMPVVFQIKQLPAGPSNQEALALVVTTKYHWNAHLGGILEEVFQLTQAEQGIVRALVEGKSAKEISADRGTSEGTVRGQIKTVLAKMNARTQSEVIRLVLSLRDVTPGLRVPTAQSTSHVAASPTWWRDEVWKPFHTLVLPDGRSMDYHVMGPVTGRPVLYSHMGYCLARWHEPMVRRLYELDLRIICPIRAGYGKSDKLDPRSDVLESTRSDTLFLLQHLGIERLPYLTQGNDLIFAADFTAEHPDMVSEVIGICARPPLPGDRHYASMGKWHRFFLSTAKHAPHLLKFTAKAAVSMARRIGPAEMFSHMNKSSPADLALLQDETLYPVLVANAELIAGPSTNVAHAYAMEILQTEAPWSHLMDQIKETKTWFINGAEDPATDVATIAEYREAYPWIDIDVIANAGQMLVYQHYDALLRRIADSM